MKNNHIYEIYKVTSILLIIDQISKLLINTKMTLNQEIVLIPKLLSILYVKNTGAAFSILQDNTIFLTVINALFIIVLHLFIKREKNLSKFSCLSLGLIMGGMFGNLIDRIIHHGVIDFIYISLIDFPVFNIADMGITIGVIYGVGVIIGVLLVFIKGVEVTSIIGSFVLSILGTSVGVSVANKKRLFRGRFRG